MIWIVKQFITHQTLEMGDERVKFPIRVELEYQQEEPEISSGSVYKKVLYNKSFLLKRYPQLKERDLDLLVEERVRQTIRGHLANLDEEKKEKSKIKGG
jgi:hypothetical protein